MRGIWNNQLIKNRGNLGRLKVPPKTEKKILNKPDSKEIQNHLERALSIREISKIVGCSTNKVKKLV